LFTVSRMTVSAEFSKFFAIAIDSSLITETATYIFVLKKTVLTAFTVSGDTSLCSCKVVAPVDFMMRSNFLGSVSDVTTTLEINGGSFDMIPLAVAAATGQRECSSSMWKPSASAPASITPLASSDERMPQILTLMRYRFNHRIRTKASAQLCCLETRLLETCRRGETLRLAGLQPPL